jgi:hypothetical protein
VVLDPLHRWHFILEVTFPLGRFERERNVRLLSYAFLILRTPFPPLYFVSFLSRVLWDVAEAIGKASSEVWEE